MNVTVDSAPVNEPITLAETKAALGIASATTTHDTLISSYITAARVKVENDTRRRLITQTLTLEWDLREWLDALISGVLYLPFPPLQSVESFTTYDADGNSTALTEDTHFDVSGTDGAKIRPIGDGWNPGRTYSAVAIQVSVGYGDDATDVPYVIRKHLLQLVGEMWAGRTGEDAKTIAPIDSELQHYRYNTV